jgi:ABC-type multidrug transport system permease subunit
MAPSETVLLSDEDKQDNNIAILAETLFLANLLLIPIIPFLVLFYLYKKYSSKSDSVAYNHLRQTLIASVLAGVFIVLIAGVFYFFSSTSAAITWTIIITYLTCVHSVFVMLGIYGLSKAMVGQKVKFPLIA